MRGGVIEEKAVREKKTGGGKGEDKIHKLQSEDLQPVSKALRLSADVSVSGTPGTSVGGEKKIQA